MEGLSLTATNQNWKSVPHIAPLYQSGYKTPQSKKSQNAFIDIWSSLACGLEEYSTVAVRLFLYKYLERNNSWNITNYFVDFTLKTLPRILSATEVGYESVLTDCPDQLSLAMRYFNRC